MENTFTSPKIKVGINARTFCEPEPDGAVQAPIRLARGLTQRAGFDVVLFGHPSVRDRVDAPVISTLYRSRSPVFGVAWERIILPALARRYGIDVLLCPNANPPLHSTPYPVVTYVHDVSAQKGWSAFTHGLYRKATVPRAARISDRVVTVSAFSRDELISHIDCSPETVDVVYNGLDERFFDETPGESVATPEKYVLFVGALNPRKNITGLIEAFQHAREALDGHELVVVGPRNKNIFKSLPIESDDMINLTGFVSLEQLIYLYDNATLFAYPSLYEGFGLPPLEAMARGTPVIASDRGAIPEMLCDAAEYIDPHDTRSIADALRRLVVDEDRLATLRKRGIKQARQFTWERAVSELSEILTEAAHERRRSIRET